MDCVTDEGHHHRCATENDRRDRCVCIDNDALMDVVINAHGLSSDGTARSYISLANASASPIMPAAVTPAPAPGPETTVGYSS